MPITPSFHLATNVVSLEPIKLRGSTEDGGASLHGPVMFQSPNLSVKQRGYSAWLEMVGIPAGVGSVVVMFASKGLGVVDILAALKGRACSAGFFKHLILKRFLSAFNHIHKVEIIYPRVRR